MQRGIAGLIVVGLVALSACTGDDDEANEATTTTTIDPAVLDSLEVPDLPPFTVASDGGEVRVTETGFSVFVDDEGNDIVSWGLVVENTSSEVAVSTDLAIELVDAAGVPAGVQHVETVVVLHPGQRFGMGRRASLAGADVAAVTVQVGGSQWLPPESPIVAFGDLTAGAVAADPEDPEGLTYATDSTYSTEVDAMASVVFRDPAGAIVGGMDRWGVIGDDEVQPGHTEGLRLDTGYAVPAADLTRSEVFLDLNRPVVKEEGDTGGSGETIEGTAPPEVFCALYEEYSRRAWVGLLADGEDPRAVLAPLAAIDPPKSIASAWATWIEWEYGWATAAAIAVTPDQPAPDHVSFLAPDEVEEAFDVVWLHWNEECVQAGDYEQGIAAVSSFDDPDELPPFETTETGEIRVVEQGYSQLISGFGDPLVSYGLVVENTSDRVAVDITVDITPVGASGEVTDADPVTIAVLQPGQRFGVGHTDFGEATAMTGLDVGVEVAEWWPADLGTHGEITAGAVSLTPRPEGGYAAVFSIDSTYPAGTGGGRYDLVFRNAEGAIVGGADDILGGDMITPGRSFGQLNSSHPMPELAVRAEAHVQP